MRLWCGCGVRVISITQQIDLTGTVGHLVAGVLFAMAEIELGIWRVMAQGTGVSSQQSSQKCDFVRETGQDGPIRPSSFAKVTGKSRNFCRNFCEAHFIDC